MIKLDNLFNKNKVKLLKQGALYEKINQAINRRV